MLVAFEVLRVRVVSPCLASEDLGCLIPAENWGRLEGYSVAEQGLIEARSIPETDKNRIEAISVSGYRTIYGDSI